MTRRQLQQADTLKHGERGLESTLAATRPGGAQDGEMRERSFKDASEGSCETLSGFFFFLIVFLFSGAGVFFCLPGKSSGDYWFHVMGRFV